MLLLETRDLSKQYGSVLAAQAVNLSLAAGETLALLGPSGSGKSTVLRLVAGLEVPSSGQVYLQGQDATHWPPERRGLGLVFQDYALFPHLRVLDNVMYGPLRQRQTRAAAAALARELLATVGLAGLEQRCIHELSGGQQQRVALARALATRPALLLLDEPLSNLDEPLRLALRRDLRALFEALGTAALLVTHDQREAAALASQVAIMRGGRVVQRGPTTEVFARPQTAWAAAFLGYRNLLAREAGQALLIPEQAVQLGTGATYTVTQQLPSEGGLLVSVAHPLGELQLHLSPREALNVQEGCLRLEIQENACLLLKDDR